MFLLEGARKATGTKPSQRIQYQLINLFKNTSNIFVSITALSLYYSYDEEMQNGLQQIESLTINFQRHKITSTTVLWDQELAGL